MKKRKVLATLLAAAMMITTMPGVTANAEEIEGGVIYVKQDIYDVTLPTTASQKFYLDPEGLIALGKGGSDTANPGTVVGLTNMYAVNRSSVPVVLSTSYKIVDSATTDGVTVVNAVDSTKAAEIEAIQDAKTNTIAISVSAVESNTDADTSGNTCGGKVFKAADAGVDTSATTGNLSTADVVYADSTAVPAEYVMSAEAYKFQLKSADADPYDANSYEYLIDSAKNEASCVKLTIGGYCSKSTDWTDYTDGTNDLKLDMVFKFKKATSDKGDWTDTKIGTDEVKVGPQVTISTTGLITISGLTADKNYKAISLTNGSANGTINSTNVTWDNTNWSKTDGGTLTCQLKSSSGWPAWYAGKTITVTVTLTDDSTVTGSQLMP